MQLGPSKTSIIRQCIVTRESHPTPQLVRFVIGPDDEVVPDIRGKLPGRGLWLTSRRDIVDRACANNLFSKTARRRAVTDEGLSDRVEGLLRDRCIEVIGLARRAGKAIAGYEKVCGNLRNGKAGVVLIACDAASGGRTKIIRLASGISVVDALCASELSQVFARTRVVYVAIGSHRLAERLVLEADRLAGFRKPIGSGKLN